MEHTSFLSFVGDHLNQFFTYTAFYNLTAGHLIMICVGLAFIWLIILGSVVSGNIFLIYLGDLLRL